MNQTSFFCPPCQQNRLFRQETMNHTPHILAAVFLCGLWLPFWIISAITDNQPWHCQFCGYSSATKYLVDPTLYAREQAEGRERMLVREQTRIDRTGSTFQERVAYFISDHRSGLIVAGVVGGTAIALVLWVSFVAGTFVQQTANIATPTPTHSRTK